MGPAIQTPANYALQQESAPICPICRRQSRPHTAYKGKLWNTPGVIVELGRHRDYLIKTPSDRILRRNRRFLWRRVQTFPKPSEMPPRAVSPQPELAQQDQPEQAEQPQLDPFLQPESTKLSQPTLRRYACAGQLKRDHFPND